MVGTERFEKALVEYVRLAEALTQQEVGEWRKLTIAPRRSKRYVKILLCDHEVFAFVEYETGDIFYPASFSSPAKHARGNIFADDPLKGTGPYGPNPLPNWRHPQ